jgi:hexosaminidase
VQRFRYTQADLASLVEYARLRAIRVVAEFDVPGHSASWCKNYPEVCTTCKAQSGSTLPLNPARNATFQLLEAVLGEVTGGGASTTGSPQGLFPGNMVHLGGDEVDADCFNRDPEIAMWMAKNGMNASDAYAYFTQRVTAMANAQGRRVVQWAEVYANVGTQLAKSSIVHIWRSPHIARSPAFNRYISPAQVVADGYQTLVNIGYDPTSWHVHALSCRSKFHSLFLFSLRTLSDRNNAPMEMPVLRPSTASRWKHVACLAIGSSWNE